MVKLKRNVKKTIPQIKKQTIKDVKKAVISVKETSQKIKKQTKKTIGASLAAAFGLTAALIWRDAVDEVIKKVTEILSLREETYILKLITALIITTVCVIFIVYFSKWSET